MPSIVKRPTDLRKSGACIEVKLWVPSSVNTELAYHEQTIPLPVDALAIIDTGAYWTIIPHGVAQWLGLKPVETVRAATASHHDAESCLYAIRLLFSNGIELETQALGAPWPLDEGQPIKCYLGRDVLKHGLLIYNGMTEMFTLIF